MDWIDTLLKHVHDYWIQFQKGFPLFLAKLVTVVVVLILARFLLLFISNVTARQIERQKHNHDVEKGKRINTVYTLLRSVSRYFIYFSVIVLVFVIFGISMEGILGVTGVVGLAVGFGAQSLIKDVVTGGFLMFENQFSVGDYIIVNNDEGVVEAIAMRVTYLRNTSGNQVIIPNGTINKVINVTRGNSLALIDIKTHYEANTQALIFDLQKLLDTYSEKSDKLVEPMKVLGIERFDVDNVTIRIIGKTKALQQWAVEREIRLLIKDYFDQHKLTMPYLKR